MKHGPASIMAIPTEPRASRPLPMAVEPSGDLRQSATRHAEPEFQDGSYGFQARDETGDVDMNRKEQDIRVEVNQDGERRGRNPQHRATGLYSDGMHSRGRGFR